MRVPIRTKFLGIIALATLAPLAISVVAIQTIGYNHLVKERGTAFQAGAAHIVESIRILARGEVERVNDFVSLGGVYSALETTNRDLAQIQSEQLRAQIGQVESRWVSLKPDNPELQSFLQNPLAKQLRAFQAEHPIFAELFVTDREGRLVASTGKTSDYFQADEEWWQRAARLSRGQARLEGLHFDDSSSTFSLDLEMPIVTPEGARAGVLKASLNASPFFSLVTPVLPEGGMVRDIVGEDGVVLLRLGNEKFQPGSVQIYPKSIAALKAAKAGWVVRKLFSDTWSMAGFSALTMKDVGGATDGGAGLVPMYVVVHEPATTALASLRTQVTLLTVAGGVLVLLFGGAGLWIANKGIIEPVRLLRSASEAVAATVEQSGGTSDPETTARAAGDRLKSLIAVHTGDELQGLARDFGIMGQRVLRYQQQLQEEIAAKTSAIQHDLDMAREFQTALMPSVYPTVPDDSAPDGLKLVFNHIYRPAATVGGDFFDVQKISPHQAGVFIADVMGHGARSALITAILRTLLQTNLKAAGDPAELLSLVNGQFHELTRQTQQTLFVTALYIVLDTANGKLACASAGHPSPLVADRTTGVVEPLFGQLKGNPALGIFPSATYKQISRPLEGNELLVLFTDGVTEAANEEGVEFGYSGLVSAVERHLGLPWGRVAEGVSDSLMRFLDHGVLADDVCLVTIDVCARKAELSERSSAGAFQA